MATGGVAHGGTGGESVKNFYVSWIAFSCKSLANVRTLSSHAVHLSSATSSVPSRSRHTIVPAGITVPPSRVFIGSVKSQFSSSDKRGGRSAPSAMRASSGLSTVRMIAVRWLTASVSASNVPRSTKLVSMTKNRLQPAILEPTIWRQVFSGKNPSIFAAPVGLTGRDSVTILYTILWIIVRMNVS
jgi:hypothetical protein